MTKAEAQDSRLDAVFDGAVFYRGRACVHGHSGIRYTTTKQCRDCERERLRVRRENNRKH